MGSYPTVIWRLLIVWPVTMGAVAMPCIASRAIALPMDWFLSAKGQLAIQSADPVEQLLSEFDDPWQGSETADSITALEHLTAAPVPYPRPLSAVSASERGANAVAAQPQFEDPIPDPSLRDMLRELIPARTGAAGCANSGEPTGCAAAATGPVGDGAHGREDLGLAESLLESRTAAALFSDVVQRSGAIGDAPVFSVLGVGQFALEVKPETHSVTIYELTSRMALPVSYGGDPQNFDLIDQRQVAEKPAQPLLLHALILEKLHAFLASPWGVLTSIGIAVLTTIWGFSRLIAMLRALDRLRPR